MKKLLIFLSIITYFGVLAYSIENTDFLSLQGLSARTLAMGEVTTMLDLGADSVFANPAVLQNSKRLEILTSYARPLEESTQLGFAAGPFNTPYGSFGVGALSFRPDLLTRTSTVNILGDFQANDSAIILSYSKSFFDNLLLGVNLAHLTSIIDTNSATAWSTDAAVTYKVLPNFSLSAIGKNIFSTNLKWNTSSGAEETLARQLIVGGAGSLQLFDRKLNLAGQLASTSLRSEVALGMEYEATRYASLRLGTNSRYPLSLGLGLNLWQLRLDYAYLTQQYFNTQKVTLSILF